MSRCKWGNPSPAEHEESRSTRARSSNIDFSIKTKVSKIEEGTLGPTPLPGSMLPSPYTHNNNNSSQTHYYTPSKPSPLSSSPLRNSPSPLKDRDAKVLSSPPRYNSSCDRDAVMSSSPSRPSYPNLMQYNQSAAAEGNQNSRMRKNQNTMITPPPQQHNRHEIYSKPTAKHNPLLHSSGFRPSSNEGRETRRKLFLKRVRETADEKRWKDRGLGGNGREEEELLRCIWMQEERKREEGRRREALGVQIAGEVDEDIGFGEEVGSSLDEMMAEEVARDEECEVEEYFERIPQSTFPDMGNRDPNFEAMMLGLESVQRPTTESAETLYGSDGEYDEIFMDVIEEEQRILSSSVHQQQLQRQPTPAYVEDEEMMDMS